MLQKEEMGYLLTIYIVFGYLLDVRFVKKHKLLCLPKGHLIQSLTAQI